MPKAYWVAHVDVHDPEIYARYREANAEAFAKQDRLGTLTPGKCADLIIVAENPLRDISRLYDEHQIRLVIKDGRVEFADDESRHHYQLRLEQPEL